ncbi:hypothetical protein [Methylocapsa acidiphila]|uniref:hypothetical protein n=1 Tax=Methylocapsa acidiphila TaxID=133552 RepID=UPI00040C6687|nr:hypothetical protein [Methylocapsa acidiphila]
MFIALGALLGVIALCPAILILDGRILPSFVPFLAAVGLILTSIKLPAAEAARFGKIAKPFAIAALIPASWMLLQLLPLPLSSTPPWSRISDLAHPVWASVAGGFPHGVSGHVSVDVGATAMALARYLSLVGVILLAIAATINRQRAESVLVGLTAASVLIASAAALYEIFGVGSAAARDEALDSASLGVIFSAACLMLVFERHETGHARPGYSRSKFQVATLSAFAAFVICATAVASARSGSLLFSASCGLLIFCAVILVRRFDLGRWGAAAIGVTASVIALALVSGAAGNSSDLRLAFVRKDPTSLELTQRALADAPFLGDGAGAFAALLPIYQSANPGPGEWGPATAAAKLSIEMGRPMLWFVVAGATIALLALLRGAATRGRDSFYPAAAAACVATLTIQAFINVGLFDTVTPLLGGIIFGLGLAQSQGRSSH